MNTHWLLQPVTQLAILGAAVGIALIAALLVWLYASSEAQASRNKFEAFRASTEANIADLNARIEDLRARSAPDTSSSVLTAVQGMNLTIRTKALRMHQRGESIVSIASALGVQQEEIDLLLKVDRMVESPII